jgi:hypothetical protein
MSITMKAYKSMHSRSMHLVENFLWKCLLDAIDVAGATSLFDALRFGLSQLLDMAPC